MRVLALLIFFFFTLTSNGQSNLSMYNELVQLSDTHQQALSKFIASIENKRVTDTELVKAIFHKAHRKFLKNYKAYSRVNDAFENGNYDCLTGTYFLSTTLERLGIQYKIYETNYHIFLTVSTEKGTILLESTDPDNGFVSDQKKIAERISSYRQDKSRSNGAQLYLSKVHLFHELTPSQLPGLLYFNCAVESFNKNQLSESCSYLKKAWEIYDNPRISGFTPILIRSVSLSLLDNATKERLKELLYSHEQASYRTVASLD